MSHLKEADAAATIRDYLANADYTPGMIGGAVGAGAGALATGAREGENPRQRALRTLRNALGAGLLGGAGSQLIAEGVKPVAEVAGLAASPKEPAAKPGIMSSPLGRLAAPLALNGLFKTRRDAHLGDRLHGMFQGTGKVDVTHGGEPRPGDPPSSTLGPDGRPASSGTPATPGGRSSAFDFTKPVDAKAHSAHTKSLLTALREAAQDSSTWDDTVKQLIRKGNVTGDPAGVKGFLDAEFGPGARRSLARGINPLPSTHLFNAGRHKVKANLGGLAQVGAYFAAPEIANGVGKAFGQEAKEYATAPVTGKPAKPPGFLTSGFKTF